MCGVFAYSGKNTISADKSLACLSHRGPDHAGQLQQEDVLLGHCRLSIIDVDERSSQPMVSASGNTSITFNGEIYNYRALRTELQEEGIVFRTEGDTEVILEGYELHGTEFFTKLRGMWALIIHDRSSNQLIAARDPFGIKPLIYALQDDSIYFSSELRCLRENVSLEPNPAAYPAFFSLGYFIAPATPYKNVYRIRPGEMLSWDLVAKKIYAKGFVSRYAEEEMKEKKKGTPSSISTYEEALNSLDRAFTDSVEAHYVADVPVAILLSGGNDSSLIAALSKKLGKNPTAYHVAIAGSTDTYYAEAVAKHLDLPLTIEILTEEALKKQYEKVWSSIDEPTGDISIIPTSLIYEKIKGREKVVLSGEGGDELFGGYLRHALLQHHSRVAKTDFLNSFMNSLLSTSRIGIAVWNPFVQRIRAVVLGMSGVTNDLIGAYLKSTRLIDFPLYDSEIRKQLFDLYASQSSEHISPPLAFDTIAYLPNDLLIKGDTASMASSIEGRVPFLDRFLARDAKRATDFDHAPLGSKHLLKEVLLRYLPRELVYRDKSGFGVPMHAYEQGTFVADFHAACAFHLDKKEEFGVNRSMAKLIEDAAIREIIVRKYPRFAFALISNWKYFTL